MPPSSISPESSVPSGGRVSWTWRPATEESEPWRIVAVVPAWQRREVLGDGDLDLGLAVLAQPDLLHRARGEAADHDLVPRHELAGVLELGRDLVLVVPAHEHDEKHCDGDDRKDRHDPAGSFPHGAEPGVFVMESTVDVPLRASISKLLGFRTGVKGQPSPGKPHVQSPVCPPFFELPLRGSRARVTHGPRQRAVGFSVLPCSHLPRSPRVAEGSKRGRHLERRLVEQGPPRPTVHPGCARARRDRSAHRRIGPSRAAFVLARPWRGPGGRRADRRRGARSPFTQVCRHRQGPGKGAGRL